MTGRIRAGQRLQIVPVFRHLSLLDPEHVKRDQCIASQKLRIGIGRMHNHHVILGNHSMHIDLDAALC